VRLEVAAFSPAHNAAAIGRPGQPIEVATAVLFLASVESSYFTAQVSLVPAPQPLAVR
jgi:NAD(P)-dependent dehydrogenase (short-subunit alcohol dehydrogenase family)